MEIAYAEEQGLSAIEYLELRHRLAPGDDSHDATQAALARTINLTARVQGELVGCARILTDGYFRGILADLLVSPDHASQGLWRELFERAWQRAPAALWVIPEYGHEQEQEQLLQQHRFGVTPNRPWIGLKWHPRRVHDPDWAKQTKDQESWDHARFVEAYNAIARARGGWVYEDLGRSPDELRERYHSYPGDHPDLHTFAEGLFNSDQRMA